MIQQPLLSILIPTVVGREAEVERLLNKVKGGLAWKEVKIIDGKYERHIGECLSMPIWFEIYKDDKSVTIGEKRETMYKGAKGLYSWQIDDDDDIADNAIQLILEAIKSNPEIPCITFRERCMMNGEYKTSNHSIKYDCWRDNWDGYSYTRNPFFKDVIRTDIAKSVPIHNVRWNEDELFSKDIYPLLTDEIHIDKELYFYIYEPKDTHEERYGIIQPAQRKENSEPTNY